MVENYYFSYSIKIAIAISGKDNRNISKIYKAIIELFENMSAKNIVGTNILDNNLHAL